jgi:hypothetical protein
LDRLEGFARALDIAVSSIISAAEDDGCEYDEENNLVGCRIKNKKSPKTIREVEAALRDAGCSRKQAVDIAAHGFKADQRESEPEEDRRESEPATVETDLEITEAVAPDGFWGDMYRNLLDRRGQ